MAHLWAAGALLVGFALRLYRLGGESLWYDETVSVYLASQSLGDLIGHTARDIHPPGYYLLLSLWRQIASPTRDYGLEMLYAWPSLFFDILAMALTFAIAKRAFGGRAAAWAVALAVVHPAQVWFAQEVRMYSLGAFLLMLTLWSVAPFFAAQREELTRLPAITRFLYPVAAVLGLYTLYYFAFWLLVVGIALSVRLWFARPALRQWLTLQIVVLIGWLPWLPTFLRQSVTPPVPAWREPWQSAGEIGRALQEAIAALWIGHVPPWDLWWPWATVVLLTSLAFYVYAKFSAPITKAFWLALAFGPLAILFAVSVLGPPVYHVRYISTYAPVFLFLVAALLAHLRPAAAVPVFTAFAVASALSLHALWTQPQFAADDHRGAVATLAESWRPGDAILVNAGWAYTALSVYWPTGLPSPEAARPPAILDFVRLTPEDVARASTANLDAPIVFRTGSVDGDPDLGWQLPQSDFFAISAKDTLDALSHLAARYPRIWHYRIYDTVSDPQGEIRRWLEENTTLDTRQPIPGRDYLMLESYRTGAPPAMQHTAAPAIRIAGTAVELVGYDFAPTITAGETLYAGLTWRFNAEPSNEPLPAIALSLRLYDQQGPMLVQKDAAFDTADASPSTQVLALPIPAGTRADTYQLRVVVYSPENLAPFDVVAAGGTPVESPVQLGNLTVLPRP